MEVRLREWRTYRGYSQERLAHEAGVTLRSYQRWEHGQVRPNVEDALRLARVLRCRVEDLFSE